MVCVTWILSITNGVVGEGWGLLSFWATITASPRYFKTLLPLELSDPIQAFFNRGQDCQCRHCLVASRSPDSLFKWPRRVIGVQLLAPFYDIAYLPSSSAITQISVTRIMSKITTASHYILCSTSRKPSTSPPCQETRTAISRNNF